VFLDFEDTTHNQLN